MTTAALFLVIGVGVGHYYSKSEIERLNEARLETGIILRALDLNNRVVMLRTLREKGVPTDDVSALEIGATTLLGTIDLERGARSQDALHVLIRTADTVRTYHRDFPMTELAPSRNASVARLLAVLDK
ncbi:MAG: hypothetical protein AB7N24_23970 [Dehalococcoidia bacterium]